MNNQSVVFDIIIVGAGPAGLAATAALAERGLRVGCVSVEHPVVWPNTYGVWVDELECVGLGDCVDVVWDSPVVVTGAGGVRRLDRRYGRLDNGKVISRLVERAERGDVSWLVGKATGWERVGEGIEVLVGETSYRARVVIDASGHFPSLVARESREAPAWQTAWGILARCKGDPMPAGASMALMDYSPIDGVVEGAGPASFLYAMDMGEGVYFLEETVLAASPPFKIEALKERLAKRLEMRGVEVVEVLETERVVIPMGLDLHEKEPLILAFGGAASMVHPATGYMVGRVFEAAGPLADALAGELSGEMGKENGSGERAVLAARAAIWPESVRRTRALMMFGLETLLKLDAGETRAFFEAFFRLEPADWAAYLSGTAAPGQIARMMLVLFRDISPALRFQFARAGFSSQAVHLLRASGQSFLNRFTRGETSSKH